MLTATESFFTLLRDPNHWLFELTVEAVTAAIMMLPIKKLIRKHDKQHHDEPTLIRDGSKNRQYVYEDGGWREDD